MNNDELLENLRLVVEVLLDEGFTRNGISIQTIEAAIVALTDRPEPQREPHGSDTTREQSK